MAHRVRKEANYALNCVVLGVLMMGKKMLTKSGITFEKEQNLGGKHAQVSHLLSIGRLSEPVNEVKCPLKRERSFHF